MNSFDFIIIIITMYCLIRGVYRGMIREISSIVGSLVGFYLACLFFIDTAEFLSDFISGLSNDILKIVSFLIIFFLIYIFFDFLARFLKHLIKENVLKKFDHVGGATFGFIKGILISSVLVLIFSTYLSDDLSFIKKSALSPYIKSSSKIMINLVPEDTVALFKLKAEDAKESW